MKKFEMRDIKSAKDCSLQGFQALHVHTLNNGHPLFKRYSQIAHLFDLNTARLIKTAKELGVRIIKVEHEGETSQHIDLCGKPFERALYRASLHLALCEKQTHEMLKSQGWSVCMNCGTSLKNDVCVSSI